MENILSAAHVIKKGHRSQYLASQTALVVYVLSLLDLLLTLYEQFSFGEIENNPFGVVLLSSPLLATVYKVLFVGACVFFLRKFVKIKLAKIAIYISFFVFALLFAYHVVTIGCAHLILFIL